MGEWRRVRIGDFLQRVKHPVRLRDDEAYKLVTVRMHHKGVVVRETKKGKLIGSNMYQVRSGQFILSGIDARHGAFGVIPDELDGAVVTNDFWYFDVDDAVVARDFFLWLTTTPLFLDACIKSSEGTTNRRRLQAERFFNFAFRFPDVAEQHRLAERFAAFDASHTALKSEFDVQSDFLKQLRQAVLQEAVEGKLTADWRTKNLPHLQGGNYDFLPPLQGEGRGGDGVKGDPNYDAAALLAQIKAEKERLVKAGKVNRRDAKSCVSTPIAESEKPFELPAGWVWCRLGEVVQYSDSGWSPNCEGSPAHLGEWGVLKTTSVQELSFLANENKRLPAGFKPKPQYEVRPGDILVTRAGPTNRVGISCVVAAVRPYLMISDKIIRLHMPGHLSNSRYIATYLNSGAGKAYIDSMKVGMAQSQVNITQDNLKKTPIPLPPLAEQQAIVARVDSLMTMIDDLEQQVAERKEQAQMLMQAVLREAFAGGEGAEASDFLPLQGGGQEGDGTEHRQPLRGRPIPTPALPLKGRGRSRKSGGGEALPLVAEPPVSYNAVAQAALPAANKPVPGGIPARILAAMQSGREYSRADLLAVTGIGEADWIWAIRQLKGQGRVVQRGEKRGARYSRA